MLIQLRHYGVQHFDFVCGWLVYLVPRAIVLSCMSHITDELGNDVIVVIDYVNVLPLSLAASLLFFLGHHQVEVGQACQIVIVIISIDSLV